MGLRPPAIDKSADTPSSQPLQAARPAVDPGFATTLAHGLGILEAFHNTTGSLSNSEIAQRTGLSRPTVSRLAYTLEELGYLDRDEAGRYLPGVGILAIAYPLLAGLKVRQMARPMMRDYATYAGGTVSISTTYGLDFIYLQTLRVADTAPHVVAQAVLAALFQRERTGRGARIETSLLEVALSLQASNFTDYLTRGIEPRRTGNGQPNNAPAAELVETKDGTIVLSAYAEDHWARFCKIFGKDDLIVDPRFCTNEARVANRSAMRAALAEMLSGYTSDDCVALLTRNQIVAGVVRGYRSAHECPTVRASGIFCRTESGSNADYETLGLPYRFAGASKRSTRPLPAIGADGAEVLRQAGFDEIETVGLLKSGVVAAAN